MNLNPRGLAVAFIAGFTVAFSVIVVKAVAAEVTPEKQAALERNGWTIADDEANDPVTLTKDGECRGKRIGSAIRNWKGEAMVRGRAKSHVCAAHGHFTERASNYAYASPSIWWDHVWGPTIDRWHWQRQDGIKTAQEWKSQQTTIDQYWDLRLTLVAHLDGEHQIWFSKRRVWG